VLEDVSPAAARFSLLIENRDSDRRHNLRHWRATQPQPPAEANAILRNIMFRLVIIDHTLNQTERRELSGGERCRDW